MNERVYKQHIETLLTVDGKGKEAKSKALMGLLVWTCFLSVIIGLSLGIILRG